MRKHIVVRGETNLVSAQLPRVHNSNRATKLRNRQAYLAIEPVYCAP